MTDKRLMEIAQIIRNNLPESMSWIDSIYHGLQSIPEFQEPKWIKCSERMPELDQPIYFSIDGVVYSGSVMTSCAHNIRWYESNGSGASWEIQKVAYWMPRIIPAPPVEEDSELIQLFREWFSRNRCPMKAEEAIAILKQYEETK